MIILLQLIMLLAGCSWIDPKTGPKIGPSGLSILATAQAEDARVLPQGRSRFSFAYGRTGGITQTFNDAGQVESLTADYNLELNSKNLKVFDPMINQLIDLLNASDYRYDEQGKRFVRGDERYPRLGDAIQKPDLFTYAEGQQEQFQMTYQYGLTDRISVGFLVPIIKTRVNTQYGLAGKDTVRSIKENWSPGGPEDEIGEALKYLDEANLETLQKFLVDNDYDRFGDWQGSGLGDLVFGSRYLYENNRHVTSSLQLGVTVPTGRQRMPREITGVDFGSRTWDAGLAHILNYKPVRFLTLHNGIHYTYRFWGSRIMRVRENPGQLAPTEADEERVRQRLGDKFWVTLGGRLNLGDVFSLSSSYEWYWKGRNQYAGSRSDRDYGYLSDETSGYLETWSLGASISSVETFLKEEFFAPGEISFNLHLPTRGRNFVIAPFGTAEIALFF